MSAEIRRLRRRLAAAAAAVRAAQAIAAGALVPLPALADAAAAVAAADAELSRQLTPRPTPAPERGSPGPLTPPRWFARHAVIDPAARIERGAAWAADRAADGAFMAGAQNTLYRFLAQQPGVRVQRSNGRRYFVGIRLVGAAP